MNKSSCESSSDETQTLHNNQTIEMETLALPHEFAIDSKTLANVQTQ